MYTITNLPYINKHKHINNISIHIIYGIYVPYINRTTNIPQIYVSHLHPGTEYYKIHHGDHFMYTSTGENKDPTHHTTAGGRGRGTMYGGVGLATLDHVYNIYIYYIQRLWPFSGPSLQLLRCWGQGGGLLPSGRCSEDRCRRPHSRFGYALESATGK